MSAPSIALPSVSVALCTHNGAAYVGEQIESILGQTLRPTQVVVSDDASADDTVAIVRHAFELAVPTAGGPVPDLTVLRNDRPLGVTANFEQATASCTADIIALSDQDDVWRPDRMERLLPSFDDPALLLLWTDGRLVDRSGEPLGRTLFGSLELTDHERMLLTSGNAFDALLRRNLATGATILFRRDLLQAARPFGDGWVHDEWLAIVAAARGHVRALDQATIDYRQHGSNQIGMARPTLAHKLRRTLEPRADRNARLATQFAMLADRLENDRGVPPRIARLAREKSAFEAERSALPARRIRRLGRIALLARRGLYRRFASRGRADIIRDLLQPA